MNDSTVRLVILGLLGMMALCIIGIIYLASANPARAIPDILVATPTGILGLIGGILVPNRPRSKP